MTEGPSGEIREKMMLLVQSGNDFHVAAKACGVDPDIFDSWMDQARQGDAVYVEFRQAMEKARAMAEATLISRVQAAASNGSWQAAAWLLERGFEGRWVRQSVSSTGEDKRAKDKVGSFEDPFRDLDNVTALPKRR